MKYEQSAARYWPDRWNFLTTKYEDVSTVTSNKRTWVQVHGVNNMCTCILFLLHTFVDFSYLGIAKILIANVFALSGHFISVYCTLVYTSNFLRTPMQCA